MADFVEIGKTGDLANGKMKEISVKDQNLLLSNINGKYYATAARCTHMGGNLSLGELKGAIVTCPRHKSQFNLTDGSVVRWMSGSGLISGVGKLIKKPTALKTYEVKVENGKISVKI